MLCVGIRQAVCRGGSLLPRSAGFALRCCSAALSGRGRGIAGFSSGFRCSRRGQSRETGAHRIGCPPRAKGLLVLRRKRFADPFGSNRPIPCIACFFGFLALFRLLLSVRFFQRIRCFRLFRRFLPGFWGFFRFTVLFRTLRNPRLLKSLLFLLFRFCKGRHTRDPEAPGALAVRICKEIDPEGISGQSDRPVGKPFAGKAEAAACFIHKLFPFAVCQDQKASLVQGSLFIETDKELRCAGQRVLPYGILTRGIGVGRLQLVRAPAEITGAEDFNVAAVFCRSARQVRNSRNNGIPLTVRGDRACFIH